MPMTLVSLQADPRCNREPATATVKKGDLIEARLRATGPLGGDGIPKLFQHRD